MATILKATEANLRVSQYCRNMSDNTFRTMIQFMDSRMAYLLSTGTSAYDACVILYDEIRVRWNLPAPKVTGTSN